MRVFPSERGKKKEDPRLVNVSERDVFNLLEKKFLSAEKAKSWHNEEIDYSKKREKEEGKVNLLVNSK